MAYIGYVLPDDVADHISKNAGVLCTTYDVETFGVPDRSNIIGATNGGVTFSDVTEFSDFGEGIDNCPLNMMELKQVKNKEVTIAGTFVAVDPDEIKRLIGAADAASAGSITTVTPRKELKSTDFRKLWYVTDYGIGGGIAIEMSNVLSTGGFSMQSSNDDKAQFSFTFTAHFSQEAPDEVPYKIYIKDSASV